MDKLREYRKEYERCCLKIMSGEADETPISVAINSVKQIFAACFNDDDIQDIFVDSIDDAGVIHGAKDYLRALHAFYKLHESNINQVVLDVITEVADEEVLKKYRAYSEILAVA